jgi:23S rRNA pseudouridine2605 synthase
MRLNKFIAGATGMSRRAADTAIAAGEIMVNNLSPAAGHIVQPTDTVRYKGRTLTNNPNKPSTTIMVNKPVGYICSRDGQGGRTVYDLLPPELHTLKPIGRLDKNSSGLLLLTTDGDLAHTLTHPSFGKTKVYKIALNHPLSTADETKIQQGITLDDGNSKLELTALNQTDRSNWKVTMSEGRNRQIRRTFDALDYTVVKLHRTHFGDYTLANLRPGEHRDITNG